MDTDYSSLFEELGSTFPNAPYLTQSVSRLVAFSKSNAKSQNALLS